MDDEEIFEKIDREESAYERKRSIVTHLDTLREDMHERDGDHRPRSERDEVRVDVFGNASMFEKKSREAQEDEDTESKIDHNTKRLVVISGIFADLFGPVELLEEDKERERMWESHGRERNPMMDRGGENRLVYPVGSGDEENDIWVRVFEAFYQAGELFGGDGFSDDITVDNEPLGFFEILADAGTFFAPDNDGVSGAFWFDVFEFYVSLETRGIFSDRFAKMTVRIGDSDDMKHNKDYILEMFCTRTSSIRPSVTSLTVRTSVFFLPWSSRTSSFTGKRSSMEMMRYPTVSPRYSSSRRIS